MRIFGTRIRIDRTWRLQWRDYNGWWDRYQLGPFFWVRRHGDATQYTDE